ncbi:hypothetical protein [Thalassospira sp.]|uniref:hypothetical protein n=1 Tax=Thalassospira sp. TaxID=1912094 RepID=UPI000C379BED|nr:hypothetical protein [Thalassospira sp.]MBC05423.1 hypothetical protein [Thalassospira sp.]|tara:strand:- start:20524 stop:21138 length:615 start_codon:yes stop_codon:yes gene_type:complete
MVTGVSGNNVNGVEGIKPGMGMEEMMMLVQAERASNLESQMADQIKEIQSRNEQVRQLNDLLSSLRAVRPSGDNPDKWADLGANKSQAREIVRQLAEQGVKIDLQLPGDGSMDDLRGLPNVNVTSSADGRINEPGTGKFDAQQKTIDTWINDIKGKIDGLNSTGQLDMIRMQSLMNKRNQAFDTLSNTLQKIQKSLDAIVGNMR